MKVLQKLQNAEPVTLAFFGDSVTHGCFERGAVDYAAVYHNRLREMLAKRFPEAEIKVINAGVGGDNVQKGLARLAADVLEKQPDFAVVCFGLNDINDALEGYVAGLGKIFDQLIGHGIETVFMTPNMLNTYVHERVLPDMRDYAAQIAQHQNNGRMDAYMDAAKEIAAAKGAIVCDCYGAWKALYAAGTDTTALLVNKINHPTREMHALFAQELFSLIVGGEQHV